MEYDKKKFKEDSRGALVPLNLVKEIDITRDDLIIEIVKRSEELNKILNEFKVKAMADIQAFVDLSAEKYEVKIGGTKGNVTLISYDGRYKVSRSINDYIVFDERLQVAKQLIDECIKRWSGEGMNEYLKVIVDSAFQVDKTGNISVERILTLRRHDIKDPQWLKAMEAISDSITVTGSKAYIRIYKRDDAGKYHQINLDLAAI